MHALVLTNSVTDLSLIVNTKMKYLIAMSTSIIFPISNWTIVAGRVRLNFGYVSFKVRLVLFWSEIWY